MSDLKPVDSKDIAPIREGAVNVETETALFKARQKSLANLWITTVRRMLKTAMYAALARWAFGLAKSLLKFGGNPNKLIKLLNGELFSMNPFKWACVFGIISSYRGVQQTAERALIAVGGKSLPITPAFCASSLFAGGVSSLGFKAMNKETRTELGLYLFIRSMHGVLTGVVQPRLPQLLKEFGHWDLVGVGLATMQIFYSLFFQPNTLSSKYNDFLRSCTMQDKRVFECLAGVYKGMVVPEMVDFCKSKGYPMPPAAGQPVPAGELCKYFHAPGTHCITNPINFIKGHFFGFSMKLYLPLKLSTTLIFGWKKCLKQPLEQAKKVLVSSVRSSLFLTGYCGMPWCLICTMTALNIRSPPLMVLLAGILSGLSPLFEPKGRRTDLALYCLMQAVRAFYNLLAVRGIINPPTMKTVTALSVTSMAVLLLQLELQPEKLHPNVSSTFLTLLGESKKTDKKKKDEEKKEVQEGKRLDLSASASPTPNEAGPAIAMAAENGF